eukprot:TRINITY_DN2311_c0_g1_i1.p1 TRINITY_DN2311_c0_g1~~TRINITY_DN2311_c0_g1_i1.p1  ORF type:complete len:299 (-),score=29.69 TRINITY_DN2311_c0_g1_i1:81-977(-)
MSVVELFYLNDFPGIPNLSTLSCENSFNLTFWVSVAFGLACSILGVINNNYSQTDRIWSIVPFIYAWIYAGCYSFSDPVLNLIAVLITLWGFRLTFNFVRRGGYKKGEQDYRWPVLQSIITNPVLWHLFNLLFIGLYQHFLLWIITVPIYIVTQHTHTLDASYLAVSALFVLLLILETTADQQQYNYQEEKWARKNRGETLTGIYAIGFNTTGLFKYSRHPNFFAEQSIWVCVYGFAVVASGEFFHWSMIGVVLLILLFQGSTAFTEWITAKKYPKYAIYQKSTSRIIPWFASKQKYD